MCDDNVKGMTGTLVAEGDSWFDYITRDDPLEGPGRDHTDVPNINPYTAILGKLFELGYGVNSAAHRGHTLNSIANNRIQIEGVKLAMPKKAPKAILLSAGGNDLFDENAGGITLIQSLLKEDGSGLDVEEVENKMKLFKANFEKFIREMALILQEMYGVDKKVPIFIHGYAYPVPDGRPFRAGIITVGPWLKPAFASAGYHTQKDNTIILEELVSKFNDMVSSLQYFRPVFNGSELSNIPVCYVDLRYCLSNEEADYEDYWENELHPTPKGFCRIAHKISEEVERYYSESKIA